MKSNRPFLLHLPGAALVLTVGLVLLSPSLRGQSANEVFDPNVNGELVEAMVVQADGKIIIGGSFTSVGGTSRSYIARLNTDGSLDNSFLPLADGVVSSLGLQPDGKILVGGSFTVLGGQTRSHLGRLNPDGTLDLFFNPGANDHVNCFAVQADGKILVGGFFTTLGGRPRADVGRLNADGSLDLAFDPGAGDQVFGLAVQPDGKILVAGSFGILAGRVGHHIGRLNADGSLDTTFDPSYVPNLFCLALQADGKIVVGGHSGLARLNADGSLDPDFTPAVNYEPYPFDTEVVTLAMQPDGKILVGGLFTRLAGQPCNHIGRLNSNGSLDANFTSDANNTVFSLAVQDDGKVLAAGGFTTLSGGPRNHVGRVDSNGRLESPFTALAGSAVVASAVQPDASILVGGYFQTFGQILGGEQHYYIARARSTGTVDSTFTPWADGAVLSMVLQTNGQIVLGGTFTTLQGGSRSAIGRLYEWGGLDSAFNPGATYDPFPEATTVNCLALQSDGKILVGGYFTTLGGHSQTNLGRLNPDGSLDTTFRAWADDYINGLGSVYSLAVQGDGKILVGGLFTTLAGQSRSRIGRLNADGTLDTTFNPGVSGSDFYTGVRCLVLQADGKILVGGVFSFLGGQGRANIGRLNANGSVDSSFNPGTDERVTSFAVQADGRILVGGAFWTLGGQARNSIGRLNADGSLDNAFNPGANSEVQSLAIQMDGKIVVGGNFSMLGGTWRNCIGRLTSGTGAQQSLDLSPEGTLIWRRSGSGPEIEQVTFEKSTNAVTYTMLGNGTRTNGGWQLAGLSLPSGRNVYVRARGRSTGGQYNGSSGLIESVRQFYVPAPRLSNPTRLSNGAFQFSFTNFSSGSFEVLATTNLTVPSSNWNALGSPVALGGGLYRFTDTNAPNYSLRFYRLRGL